MLPLLLCPLVGLLAFLFLPWARTDRIFFAGGASALKIMLSGTPALWLTLIALAGSMGFSFLDRKVRGMPVLVASGFGFLVTASYIVFKNSPVDVGAVVVAFSLLAVVAMAMSDIGIIKADRFIAISTLWIASLLVLFVMYPLIKVLRGAFGETGFSLDAFASVISSPKFYVLENETTKVSETQITIIITILGAIACTAWSIFKKHSISSVIRTGLVSAVGIGFLASMVMGFGAFRNSILLSISVAFISTLLAFAFALLGTRSRIPFGPYLALPLAVAGYAGMGFFTSTPQLKAIAIPMQILGIAVGLAVAWFLTKKKVTAERFLGIFSLLPIITPPFVIGFALIFLLGRQGIITKGIFGQSTDALMGETGVAIAQVLAFTPIAYLTLAGVVKNLNGTLEEAAITLGADRMHVLRTVIWPLVRPGLANAFLLTIIESLADFGNPFVMGGSFLATEVYLSLEFSPSEASVYGTILLGLSIAAFLAQQAWLGRTSFTTVTGKPTQGVVTPLPPLLEKVLLVVFTIWLMFVGAIYGSMIFGSLVKLWGFNNTFTLEHIINLQSGSKDVFLNTLKIALISSVPVLILSVIIAFLITRQKFFGRGFIELGSLLSFAVPGTVIGIGYVMALNGGFAYMTGTVLILIIAFVFRNMPVGIRSAVANLRQIDPALEEASTTLRASAVTTLTKIVMPLIRPALISAVVFAVVRAMTAISQVIFLISPDTKLVTSEILSMVERGQLGDAAALSVLLVVVLAAIITIMNLVLGRFGKSNSQVNE